MKGFVADAHQPCGREHNVGDVGARTKCTVAHPLQPVWQRERVQPCARQATYAAMPKEEGEEDGRKSVVCAGARVSVCFFGGVLRGQGGCSFTDREAEYMHAHVKMDVRR